MTAAKVGTIWRDARITAGREPRTFLLLVAIAMAPGLLGLWLLDTQDQRLTILVSSLLNLYLQLFATCRALYLLGAMPADYRRDAATEGRYPSAWLASLLSTVAILIGLVLLVAPGLLLLVLWSVWMPALASERLGPVDALRRSWRLVRPRFGTVLLLWLPVGTAYVMSLLLPVGLVLVLGQRWIAIGDIAVEPLLALALIGSAILWACAYRRLVIDERERLRAP